MSLCGFNAGAATGSLLCTHVDQQSRGLPLEPAFRSPRLISSTHVVLPRLGLLRGLLWGWSEPPGKRFAKRQLQLTASHIVNSSIVNWT